jgi:hypothetical protein
MVPVIIIIFVVLISMTLLVVFYVNRYGNKPALTDTCESDSDCQSSYSCQVNPDSGNIKQCFPKEKFFCSLTPQTELVACPLGDDGNNYCASTCLNTPSFACVGVSDDKPYSWKKGEVKINIPNSSTGFGWCLPDIVNRDVTCNQFTSDYVLEQVGEDNKFQWGCHCKYPNLFDHAQNVSGADCTVVRSCGHTNPVSSGDLYVPKPDKNGGFISCKKNSDCSETGDICLNPVSSPPCNYDPDSKNYNPIKTDCSLEDSKCVCHTKWLNIPDKIDPLSGQCVCKGDAQFQCLVSSPDLINMNCVDTNQICHGFIQQTETNKCNQNNCFNRNESGECICCTCPTGYIRCPDDCLEDSLINYCKSNGPTCIPDPCNTVSIDNPNGYYNIQTRSCVCNPDSISQKSETSSVGETCIDICNLNNPCGNRGDCVVINNQPQCENCRDFYINTDTNKFCDTLSPDCYDNKGNIIKKCLQYDIINHTIL